jgi:hypothetical protein
MSYPQFAGYSLGSLVQSISDLETNLGQTIANLPTSPIKSRQSGYVNAYKESGYSQSEDSVFIDIDISNVDYNKCLINIVGGGAFSAPAVSNSFMCFYKSGGAVAFEVNYRIIDGNKLRLSMPYNPDGNPLRYGLRWHIIEFN